MAKQYRWQIQNYYQKDSGDDNYLTGGADSSDLDWHPADEGYKELETVTYYYHDTNTQWTSQACNCCGVGYYNTPGSIVEYPVKQSWTASYDSLNNLTISIHTQIGTVKRSKTPLYNCGGQTYYDNNNDTPRTIRIYKGSDTQNPFANTVDNTVGNWGSMDPKTLFNSMDLGTYTLTLAPGTSAEISSLKIDNQSTSSFDILWAGVRFQNPLPAPVTYTLTYNANGGTGAPAADTAYTVDDTHTFTVTNSQPTWGSFIFLGWSNSPVSGSGTPADVDYVAGDTITLPRSNLSKTIYAVWEKDYRPGTSLDTGTSVWKSHNRTNGAAHVLSNTGNMTWTEMRTIGGAENEQGNPPVLARAANATSFYNQKKLGQE